MDQEHIDRVNAVIPTVIKALGRDLFPVPDERLNYDGILKDRNIDGIAQAMIVHLAEGSEDATDEEFVLTCATIMQDLADEANKVADALWALPLSPAIPSLDESEIIPAANRIEYGDTVLVTDEEGERFEGKVLDMFWGEDEVVWGVKVDGKYGKQVYKPNQLELVSKWVDENE